MVWTYLVPFNIHVHEFNNTECIYAKSLNVIVLSSEEVSLKYVIHYQIEMNFAMDSDLTGQTHTFCVDGTSQESLWELGVDTTSDGHSVSSVNKQLK